MPFWIEQIKHWWVSALFRVIHLQYSHWTNVQEIIEQIYQYTSEFIIGRKECCGSLHICTYTILNERRVCDAYLVFYIRGEALGIHLGIWAKMAAPCSHISWLKLVSLCPTLCMCLQWYIMHGPRGYLFRLIGLNWTDVKCPIVTAYFSRSSLETGRQHRTQNTTTPPLFWSNSK
jgi:hypothetical protein